MLPSSEPSKVTKNVPEKHRFLQHDPFVEGHRILNSSDVFTYKEDTKGIGIMGDATDASHLIGEQYHNKFLENLVELIDYCENDVIVNLRNRNIPL